MRIRIRGPQGSSLITLADSDSDAITVGDLLRLITEKTSLERFEVRYRFPPVLLSLESHDRSRPLSDLGISLDGEQLLISPKDGGDEARDTGDIYKPAGLTSSTIPASSNHDKGKTRQSVTAGRSGPGAGSALPPLSLSRAQNKALETDPPQIPVPEHGGTLVLRIMPDDNSCLFRAFGTAVMGAIDSMIELRAIIAEAIQAQPDTYSAAVLDQPPDEYCKWIQTEHSWGGFIELNILSTHFDVEVCSIDVQTLRVDRFNEGRSKRCILVYSGIHYDTIALSPSDPPYTQSLTPPDFDTRVFDSDDDVILEKAVALCRILQGKHYYTDTASFNIRCNVCGGQFVGENGATEHAKATGHYDFGEA